MQKHGTLNYEQARFYRDQGYYRLTGAFNQQQTAIMRQFVLTEAGKVIQDNLIFPNGKIYGLYDRHPELMQQVIGNKALIGALESLLGPNIVFVKNRHNHATINDHQGDPAEGMHRDTLQPSRGLITAAIYLQDSTVSNGATRIVPGSHNLPYVGVPQPNGGGTWMAEHDEYAGLEDQALPVPMTEGSVLLFNSNLFHGVGRSTSDSPRMSMTLGYRSADELDAKPDDSRQIIVHGEHIYRGNDS